MPMEAKRRARERYGAMESALHQALQDNEVEAERRHKEMGSLQQMVATSDGMGLLLGSLCVVAVGVSLLYLPSFMEGDALSVTVLGVMAALLLGGTGWQLYSGRKRD